MVVMQEDESGSGMSSAESGTPDCPSSLSLLLPNTKLTSAPTQQHGRPCLWDWSHTAGDEDPSGAAGPGAAEGDGGENREENRREHQT